MSEPIYIDDLLMEVVKLDESTAFVTILANDVGIAGDVSLDLLDGVTIRTDFADPETLVGIEFEVSQITGSIAAWQLPSGIVGCLELLIGPKAAVEIERNLTLNMEGHFPIRGKRAPVEHIEQWRSKGRDAALLGRALHLLDIADDPDQSAGVRLLAACEATDFHMRSLSPLIRENVLRVAREIIAEIRSDDENFDGLDDLTADFEELSSRNPEGIRKLKELLVDTETFVSPSLVDFGQYLISILDSKPLAHYLQESAAPKARDSRQEEVRSEDAPSVHEASPGRLVLTWKSRPLGEQVRVLTRDDLTLVALAPIVPTDDGWMAEVVIPVDFEPSRLLFGSTTDPFPLRAGSTFEQVMEAVDLGRAAVIKTKSEDERSPDVEQAWLRCALAWERLGDLKRRDIARDFLGRRSPKRERFISDEVRLLLEERQIS